MAESMRIFIKKKQHNFRKVTLDKVVFEMVKECLACGSSTVAEF